MSLYNLVRCRDFKSFEALISSGEDLTKTDEYGNTILHALAAKKEDESMTSALRARIFLTPKLLDWHYAIRSSFYTKTRGTNSDQEKAFGEFVRTQNYRGDTCLHVAVEEDNWNFASFITTHHYHFKIYDGLLKRNSAGLTEYELALLLYGTRGRREHLGCVFGDYAEVWPCVRDLPGLEIGLKAAAKAQKYVKVGLKNGRTIDYRIGPEDELYVFAREQEYPSPHATFDDPTHLLQLRTRLNKQPA